MKLAAINDNLDLFRITLNHLLPEPLVGQIVMASRLAPAPTQPGAVLNGIIDEGFLGNLLYGGLMQARAALSGLPPAIAKNPRIKAIMQRASQVNGNLLDGSPETASWWLGLVGVFREMFTNPTTKQPVKPYEEIAQTLKKQVTDEASQWVQHTDERDLDQAKQTEFDQDYNAMSKHIKQRYKIQKLLARYGVDPATVGMTMPGQRTYPGQQRQGRQQERQNNKRGSKKSKQQQELAALGIDTDAIDQLADPSLSKLGLDDQAALKKYLRKQVKKRLARQQRGALTMPPTEAAMVVAAAAGIPLTEGLAEGLVDGLAKLGWKGASALGRGLGAATGIRPVQWGKTLGNKIAQPIKQGYKSGNLQGQAGRFLGMFNPTRRAAIGQGFVSRSLNKLIAALAVKAAADLAQDLSQRLRTRQGGRMEVDQDRRGQKTMLAPNRGGAADTTLAPNRGADTTLPSARKTRIPRS